MSIAIFPLPDELRALAEECQTCHGEPCDIPCPECNDEPDRVLEAQLANVKGMEIERSALGLAMRISELEAEALLLDEHVKKLMARAGTRRRSADFLKAWLKNEMEAAGVDKLKNELVTVWLQDNPPSIELVDETKVSGEWKRATLRMPYQDVPAEWTQYIVSYDIPKTPLREHIEATGEIPPGCEYHGKGHTRHLRIKT